LEEQIMRYVLRILILTSILATAFAMDINAFQGGSAASKAPSETVIGTIDYTPSLGGYFIRGENPGGEFFVVNQNPAVLKALKESRKSVKIQGYTTSQGAEYFFIEKIDDKKYKAAKTAK
jgi:hypothetical protein